jgi:hypothetical protein
MNLMIRDNLSLPEDYYVNNFLSDLSEYIQAHLQCHKPEDMLHAIWLARRMEIDVPQKITYSNTNYPVTIQVQFEPTKPVNATPANTRSSTKEPLLQM